MAYIFLNSNNILKYFIFRMLWVFILHILSQSGLFVVWNILGYLLYSTSNRNLETNSLKRLANVINAMNFMKTVKRIREENALSSQVPPSPNSIRSESCLQLTLKLEMINILHRFPAIYRTNSTGRGLTF